MIMDIGFYVQTVLHIDNKSIGLIDNSDVNLFKTVGFGFRLSLFSCCFVGGVSQEKCGQVFAWMRRSNLII